MGKTIAIIGASADRRKYGNKAVRAFRDGGWTVYPVNPKGGPVEEIPSYTSLADVPTPLDRVSMYVPPKVGLGMIEDIVAKAPEEVFFNPGSEDPEVIEAAKAAGLNAIEACSIVNIGLRPDQYPDE